MKHKYFKEPILAKFFESFEWTRGNTIQLFEVALDNDILNYKSTTIGPSKYTFQPLLFQFQCIISTTDTYYRKLTAHQNQRFGILVRDDIITSKKDIRSNEVKNLLKGQIVQLEELLRDFDLKNMEGVIDLLLATSNHEYLHQGQMIIDFRESGKELPGRFRKAWAL